jgi:hypothetical protein
MVIVPEDILKIGNKEIPVRRMELPQAYLKYYPENPRIYSLVYDGDKNPNQSEIETKLGAMEHVKKLVQSIKANGGLIDPIIVRDKDYVVLEGNSRLAAYRILAKTDAVKWGKVSSIVLPSDIGDSLIFTLLGQYHIIGRKDWLPFEQAGYLWRRQEQYSVSASIMAKEMGMPEGEIKRLISIYSFMKQYDDVAPDNWSYYVEYLRSRALRKYRQEIPNLDRRVTDMVKTNEISVAMNIRTKLESIAKVKGQKGQKLMITLADGKKTFEECFAEAEKSGYTNNLYQILNKFRTKIADPSIKRELKRIDKKQQDRCGFELKKIEEAIKKMRESLGAEDDEDS